MTPARRHRMLDFRGGGWVLLLAGVVGLVFALRVVVPALRKAEPPRFDLSTCLVPRASLVSGGFPKDGIPALTVPAAMTPEEADELNVRERGKYLVSTDRVIGVRIGREARAYPLRVLNWHEVVNDVVGGRPVAVTYSPLCDSAVVFSREAGGENLEFGVSGLLLNSNLVMHDRRSDPSDESLWSQLQARAVAGPAAEAGLRLDVLPCSLVTWAQWRQRYPATTLLEPDPAYRKRYARDPYGSYHSRGVPRFPVEPLPEGSSRPLMARIVAVEWAGRSVVLAPEDAMSPSRHDLPGGVSVELDATSSPWSVFVDAPEGASPAVFHAFWFSWYASRHPAPREG